MAGGVIGIAVVATVPSVATGELRPPSIGPEEEVSSLSECADFEPVAPKPYPAPPQMGRPDRACCTIRRQVDMPFWGQVRGMRFRLQLGRVRLRDQGTRVLECNTHEMDCYLEAGASHALAALRGELMTYLRRHGDPGSDFDSAELLIGEAAGNAIRHTTGPVWVSLLWRDRHPVLTVHDLGPGFDSPALIGTLAASPLKGDAPARPGSDGPGFGDETHDPDAVDLNALAESGRGLMIMRELAPALESRARTGDGLVLSVSLPVTRPRSVSHDPPRRRTGALPMPAEALPYGGFGKESFLRALVVQLAQTVEIHHGQDAADAAVAQVGTDVGGRMLEEFRLAKALADRMTSEEIGRCYVRLKHAIDGGFRVIEATAERIILVNDRCPFGDAVQQAPSLCRMTSSVFGGIAARNTDQGATVLLEERIALGDPGCRVVVELGIAREQADPAAHYYATPVE